jgi:hypothetical protein
MRNAGNLTCLASASHILVFTLGLLLLFPSENAITNVEVLSCTSTSRGRLLGSVS